MMFWNIPESVIASHIRVVRTRYATHRIASQRNQTETIMVDEQVVPTNRTERTEKRALQQEVRKLPAAAEQSAEQSDDEDDEWLKTSYVKAVVEAAIRTSDEQRAARKRPKRWESRIKAVVVILVLLLTGLGRVAEELKEERVRDARMAKSLAVSDAHPEYTPKEHLAAVLGTPKQEEDTDDYGIKAYKSMHSS